MPSEFPNRPELSLTTALQMFATQTSVPILAPASSTRNVIQPTGNFIPLVLKGFAGQTAALFNITDSADVQVLFVDPSAGLNVRKDGATPQRMLTLRNHDLTDGAGVQLWARGGTSGGATYGMLEWIYNLTGAHSSFDVQVRRSGTLVKALTIDGINSAYRVGIGLDVSSPTARLDVRPLASEKGIVVRANASTPDNLQEWQNSGGTALALISALGGASVTTLSASGLATLLAGIAATVTDAAPAANTDILTLDHALTSGGGSNNIAAGILLRAMSSLQMRETGRVRGVLTTATDGSRIGALIASAYNIGTPVDMLWVTPFGIGIGVAPVTTNLIHARKDQNAATPMLLTNLDSGGAAQVVLSMLNNANQGLIVRAFSSGFTTSGLNEANRLIMDHNGANGFYFGASNAAGYLALYTGSLSSANERLRITAAGLFTLWDGGNFQLGTTTGTKWGTSASQKQAWWNATPVVQSAGWAVANPVSRKTFDTTTITHQQLAEVVGTLITRDLSYGLSAA